MKTAYKRLICAFAGLASIFLLGVQANAECGMYRPLPHNTGWQPQIGSPRLMPTALIVDDDAATTTPEPSMVGTWKEHWISYGTRGIKDGDEVDAGYSQWHSDGNEINLSGLRSPLIGDVCMGVWEKTGTRTYRLNHFGISYDPTGEHLVGPAHIQQWITISSNGQSMSGKFTIDQYDEAGNLLAHVQGRVYGTRVTITTGFQKVQ